MEKREEKSNILIYVIAFVVNLNSIAAGICWAWSSPAIPQLDGSNRPDQNPLEMPATLLESSWIASLCHLGAATGPWLSALFANRVGRKNTLLYSIVPLLVSHSWLIFASTVIEFCVARFLMGVSIGCALSVIPMYLSELAEKETRGSVGIFMFLQLNFGQLTVFSISTMVPMRFLSVLALISATFFIIFFYIFVPESPYYFASKNLTKQAEECLKKLRRRSDVEKELLEVMKTVEESNMGNPGFQDLYKSYCSFSNILIFANNF